MQNLYLIGFMGSGKSTVANAFKEEYRMHLIEMDEEIIKKAQMSIPDIFNTYGESYFRDLETALLKEIQNEKNQIVSCGGGLVLRPENVTIMKESGTIILLEARPETILERVKNNDDRPLLHGNMNVEYISSLMEKRRARYESAADLRIITDGKSAIEICSEIIERLN